MAAISGQRPRRCLSVISQTLATLTNTLLPGAAIAALAARPKRSGSPSHQANVWVSSSSAESASAGSLWAEILGALAIPEPEFLFWQRIKEERVRRAAEMLETPWATRFGRRQRHELGHRLAGARNHDLLAG